jgi:DNA topoisomerase-1
MPKKPIVIKTTLVIVESPAKCKKIEEYLGPGYKCIASFGHLRELASLENIKTKENYKPIYTIINQPIKRKQIDLIKKKVATAYEVILACDADREGEAICFHLCELFGLSMETTKRILFHEITPNAIKEAIKNPQKINMHLVQAQQARQVLDLLVGFKITPLLWKYISKNSEHSLSAGRCQTPALKIIYENQQEINDNMEEKTHRITGYFTNLNIPFILNKEFCSEEEVTDFLFGSSTFPNYHYSCSKPEKVFKKQPEPFSTSTLQQKASNEFHYSPKETMKIAQQLYEGGFITYMRTDCKLYSKEFVDCAKEYIIKTWDEKYIIERGEASTHARVEDVETPHEAIRPTNIELKELPITVTDAKQRKLYNCIWENTLESCMAPASYYTICARIKAFNNTFFNNKSEQIDFLGWKVIKNVKKTEKTNETKEYHYLQTITPNMVLTYKKMVSNVTLKNTKSHYTEARLVQILEEKGIGRPSTFSSIVEKIQEREYVKKENISGKTILCKEFELEKDNISETEYKREFGNEKNKLVIQPLGIMVIEFLEKHFSSLFQYDYTREMEDNLDKVAKGEKIWYSLCESCDTEVNDKIQSMKDGKERKIEYFVDENHVYIIGKHGPVIKYLDPITKETSFKSVKKDIDMERLKAGSYSLDEIIDISKELDLVQENTFGFGIFENEQVILKKGKYGLYITWGSKKKNLKELGNRPIESIRFEEIEKILQDDSSGDIIREISDNIQIRKGKKNSDYIFFKTSKMKKPQFFSLNHFKENYRTCDKESIQHWIKETYNVY